MKAITSLLFLSCIFFSSYAAVITVNNQSDWNTLVTPVIMASDTVIITESATIVNISALDIQGTIVNNGDFTMNGTGIAVNMMGMIHNYGTWTVGNTGLSIVDGIFINIGVLTVQSAAIVVQMSGMLYNLGTINNFVDIAIYGEYQNCGIVNMNAVRNEGGTLGSTVPAGTPCNDMDDGTINDVTIDDACTCEGERVPTIPTLSQWAIILLLLSLFILGITALKRQKVSTYNNMG